MKRHGLSKSRITAFEQCPKKLWLGVHRIDLADWDESAKGRFNVGNAVGDIACALHPGGVMVEANPNLSAALEETARLLAVNHHGPIFEATFQHAGVLVRVDVLSRSGAGQWHAAEVKSSASVKDYHRGDLATQIWVLRGAGLPLSGASIRHIDRDFILTKEGDYEGLFFNAEIMGELEDVVLERGRVVEAARTVLTGPEPEVSMGAHCTSPFGCEFTAYCGRDLPPEPQWPLECLPGQGRARWAAAGCTDILDLPEGDLSPVHAKVLAATRDDKPFRDPAGARAAMEKWNYPRAWLDFETIAPAVPRWVGTRPFQQVPFQFSLHLEQADGTITHREFLSLDGSDPRAACAEALVRMIPDDATIIAYFAAFERGVLRDLACEVPEFSAPLLAMADRTVDLLPVARNNWYHREQRGSWSIKAVLPTIAPELGYESLEVKDGGSAQEAWLEATHPACVPTSTTSAGGRA